MISGTTTSASETRRPLGEGSESLPRTRGPAPGAAPRTSENPLRPADRDLISPPAAGAHPPAGKARPRIGEAPGTDPRGDAEGVPGRVWKDLTEPGPGPGSLLQAVNEGLPGEGIWQGRLEGIDPGDHGTRLSRGENADQGREEVSPGNPGAAGENPPAEEAACHREDTGAMDLEDPGSAERESSNTRENGHEKEEKETAAGSHRETADLKGDGMGERGARGGSLQGNGHRPTGRADPEARGEKVDPEDRPTGRVVLLAGKADRHPGVTWDQLAETRAPQGASRAHPDGTRTLTGNVTLLFKATREAETDQIPR